MVWPTWAFWELFLKAGEILGLLILIALPEIEIPFSVRTLSEHFTTVLTVWWSGFDTYGRTGLLVRIVTRIGAVKGNSFPPQQKTAHVKTRLPLVFGYCLVSATELSNAPLLWFRPFSPACTPPRFHLKQSETEPSLKRNSSIEEKCLFAEDKWDLNGAEKARFPSVSLPCC